MKIPVEDLQIGDRTGSDVFNWNGLLVVSAHTVLNEDDIEKLQRHQIDYVDIMIRYNGQAGQSQPAAAPASVAVAGKQVIAQTEAYQEAVDGIKQLFEQIQISGAIHEDDVQQCFAPLANQCEQEHDVVSLLLTLNNKDDYTYQHSVQVGMISYYIAKWLGQTESDALLAGKAGYLHDIGKSKIDNAILQKPAKLTEEEFSEVKRHTHYGYEMIKACGFNEALALAALQHHERLDGSGYPLQLKGTEIHPMAKIVAVADIYSAMISQRIYQEKQDLLYVLKELHRMSFGMLDAQITQVFIRNMLPNFIGKKALLTSGEVGIIILTHPTDFFNPLVQVDDHFINLAERPDLEIQEIYM
ncbi:HD domain-containing phosphohydrolase [Paenibacillus rigui]|uniref:HD family phosphohydrolase n=1 Tax=Paenibacillus rigui TaxID=554312 RepID=A0A229ULF2_9BACL|nr:HD domain-containing phosphohydrolase [Paenibacillus rigui]OXM84240.1 HD family phosphohydrolase [Paenibacillus rigui]